MFWLLDKQTNTPGIFGSIKAICNHTDLKRDSLYTVFGRKKSTEYEKVFLLRWNKQLWSFHD